jgi:hypothetical protein
MTLLVICIVPKPVPPTVIAEVSQLCIAGLRETRDVTALASLRSLGVSKILKEDISNLKTQISAFESLPAILSPQILSLMILSEINMAEISPLLVFLTEIWEDHNWEIMLSVSQCLEKSTQGRVISDLQDRDVRILNPILQFGISDFNSNGNLSIFFINPSSY